MYRNALVEWLRSSRKLVFTTEDASNALGLKGPSLIRVLDSSIKHGEIGKVAKGYYYYAGAPVKDIFAIASKIVYPSYIATESAFERYGASNIIPKTIRVATTKLHRPIMFGNAKIVFIKFKKENFFGYNESRWISISTIEKAFVDSMYLGEFPFFTDLVSYYKKLESFGRDPDAKKIAEFALRMDSKVLVNRVGAFLYYVGREDAARVLLPHVYKKRPVHMDRSGYIFENKKWAIN